jgi:hypothetical protein
MVKTVYGLGIILLIGSFLVTPSFAASESQADTDDEIFAEINTIEDQQNVVSEEADQELKKQHLGISTVIKTESVFTYYGSNVNWLGNKTDSGIRNEIGVDLSCDIRWKKGVKSFLCLGAELYPEGSVTPTGTNDKDYHDFLIKECFTDANWKNKAYFRFGKQVLKWGRSYFWNPTDLINVNKKAFYNLDENQKGTSGVKIHIPYGVRRNVYFFSEMEDIDNIKDVACAGKYEWLTGGSEMSLSVWYKDGFHPVFGYDISTRFGKVDLQAEIALFNGLNYKRLEYDGEQFRWTSIDGWYPQLSCGFTRYFDYGEINDRISVTGEFFYNQAGYDKNIYRQIDEKTGGDRRLLLKQQYFSEYQEFRKSKYYGAIFSTVNKLFLAELSLKVNGIINLVDYSTCLMTGISYKPTLKDCYINFDIYNYFGDSLSEAKFMGYSYQLNLGVKYLF